MATLASLVVSLEANVARFESDLNKAEFMAKKAMDTIGNVPVTWLTVNRRDTKAIFARSVVFNRRVLHRARYL